MEQRFPSRFGDLAALIADRLAVRGELDEWLRGTGYSAIADRVRRSESPDEYAEAVLRTLDRHGLLDTVFFTRLADLDDGAMRADVARIAADMGQPIEGAAALLPMGEAVDLESTIVPPSPTEESTTTGTPSAMVGLRLPEWAAMVTAARSVAQLRDRNGLGVGSGVLVTADLLAVPDYLARSPSTAPVDGTAPPDVASASFELPDGLRETVPVAEVIAVDPDRRLGLCRLERPPGEPVEIRTLPPLPGDRLTLIHFPLGGSMRLVAEGARVVRVDRSELEFVAPTVPGSGGAGLFDGAGRLVAMSHRSATPSAPEARERTSFGPLAAEILAMLGEQANDDQRATVRHDFEPASPAVDALAESAFAPESDTRVLPVILELSDEHAVVEDLPGVEVSSRWGPTVSARIDQEGFEALKGRPDVISIDASRAGGDIELVVPSISLMQAHPVDVGGEGGEHALVAIIDNGVDVSHETFNPGGTSKVIAYWDQAAPARPADGHSPASADLARSLNLSYGRLYLAADLDAILAGAPAQLPPPADCAHGTAVASLAAGAPCPGDGAFAGGVSPRSPLVVVRFDPASVDPGYVQSHIDALAFIEQIAEREQLPVVVNISSGTNAGGHDGFDTLELVCDRFCDKPGRVVVKSAGNERLASRHCEHRLSPGAGRLTFDVADEDGGDHLELWWPSGVEVRVDVVDPSGTNLTGEISSRFRTITIPAGGATLVADLRPRVDRGGRSRGRLTIDLVPAPGQRVPAGRWRLDVVVSGRPAHPTDMIHGWIESPRRSTRFTLASSRGTVTIPGTTWKVICVGALAELTPLMLLDESSEGFENLGEEKPDIVAPGGAILAAQAGTADRGHAPPGLSGTSYAAPHVAGAVALGLSKAVRAGITPWPSATEVLTAVREHTPPEFVLWDPRTGHGPMNVPSFLKTLEEILQNR